MTKRLTLIGLMAAMSVLASAPMALAQLSKQGGAIEISADRGELDDVQRRAVYMGNVDVIQGDVRLRAEKVTINYASRDGQSSGIGSSVGDITTISAEGEVFYITAKEKVKASKGVYDAQKETIRLTGRVLVTNADGVIEGENLLINIPTGRYTMDGGNSGRVKTVIDQIVEESPTQ